MFKSQKGVTIIEFLFVLTISAIIMVYVLQEWQSRAKAERVKSTLADFKVVLEAGVAYYDDFKVMPATTQVLTDGNYLPANFLVKRNPYNPDPSSGRYIIRPTSRNAVEVSSTLTNATTAELSMIAAQLPSATVAVKKLTTQVPVTHPLQRGYVLDQSNDQSGYTIYQATFSSRKKCMPGYKLTTRYSIQGFYAGKATEELQASAFLALSEAKIETPKPCVYKGPGVQICNYSELKTLGSDMVPYGGPGKFADREKYQYQQPGNASVNATALFVCLPEH